MKQIAYEYKNCPIPGGGFVTGLLFANDQESMYARTDIGGLYRRDFKTGRWIPLNDDVTSERLAATYPLSVASDKKHPEYLYAVCGTYREEHGYLMVSHDRGESFLLKPLPCKVHGNTPGRSTGERLLCADGMLYFASQTAGLWRSDDEGGHWRPLFVKEGGREEGCVQAAAPREREEGKPGAARMKNAVQTAGQQEKTLPADCPAEQNLTLVWKHDRLLVVGCNGAANRISDEMRGAALYISHDGGEHFTAMPQPQSVGGFSGIAGFVPQRCCYDGAYLYVTFLETEGSHYAGMDSCSFDTGGCHDGRVWRYRISDEVISAEDITPCGERILAEGFTAEEKYALIGIVPPEYRQVEKPQDFSEEIYAAWMTAGEDARKNGGRLLSGGISGIDCHDGMLLCSTGGFHGPDVVFASMDRGEHWLPVLCGLAIGNFCPDAVSYMKPEYNGGGSIIHWLSDIKINPYRPDEAYFTTGTGIFRCEGLDAVRQELLGGKAGGRRTRLLTCYPDCEGLEETVHLNVYSFPKGPVRVLDIVGDLGGFAFQNPAVPCENSFADECGNRYITCLNADFPEQYPNMLVTGARGNWTGKTKGGALLSRDQGQHFVHLPYPEGLSEKLDALVADIKRPNVNAGYVAVSADGARVLWAVAQRGGFASDCTVYMDITPGDMCAVAEGGARYGKTAANGRMDGKAKGAAAEPLAAEEETRSGDAAPCAWRRCEFYDLMKEPLAQPVYIHLYADRLNPQYMYAFGNGGRIFLSVDKGESFYETELPEGFPKQLFSHWSVNCQVTADYTQAGVLYLAVQESGLYRLKLRDDMQNVWADRQKNTRRKVRADAQANKQGDVRRDMGKGMQPGGWELTCLSAPGDYARCVGLGCGYEKSRKESRIIYVVGRIGGTYGFYRSLDEGGTWERINNERQMFGEIRAICGDRREAGVFYLASGSRGLLCGEPKRG